MAGALDVSPSFLCKVEKGLLDPSEKFIQMCSEYLNVPVDKLFPEEKKKARAVKKIQAVETEAENMLWHIRQERGIKQYELAQKLSCSPSFLSKVEKGLQSPNDKFKKKCARILKVKENVLFP